MRKDGREGGHVGENDEGNKLLFVIFRMRLKKSACVQMNVSRPPALPTPLDFIVVKYQPARS